MMMARKKKEEVVESETTEESKLTKYTNDKNVKVFFRDDKLLILRLKPLDIFTCADIVDMLTSQATKSKEVFKTILPTIDKFVEVDAESEVDIDVELLASEDQSVNPLVYIELSELVDALMLASNMFPRELVELRKKSGQVPKL